MHSSKSAVLRQQLDAARAAQRLFLGDGGLSEDARVFFRTLATFCQINSANLILDNSGRADGGAHIHRDGKRAVWDHIQQMLSADVVTIESTLIKEEGYNDVDG